MYMRHIPTIITVSNIFLGILSLRLILIGRPEGVLFIIPIAAFFDLVDGYLARRLNTESEIGCILDSFSDLICFALVPSFYIFMMHKEHTPIFLILACIFYLLSGITRLMRYTVSKLKTDSRCSFFLGCPVTAVALCIVLATRIYESAVTHILLLVICSYFMISRIEYTSLAKIINRYSKEAPFFIYAFLLLPFFLFYPLETVFTIACIYLLFFPIKHISSKYGIDIYLKKAMRFLAPAVLKGAIRKPRVFSFAKGTRHIIMACAVSLLMSIFFLPAVLKIFYLIVLIAIAFFFRDPERMPKALQQLYILAPADGRVISVKKEFYAQTGGRFNKISIFLSIFDVHVNRAPAELRVLKCEHYDGGHLHARHPKAADNEHNLLTLELLAGQIVLLKLVAGRFARRILSYVKQGDMLNAGEKLSIILFGSRVELFLPENIEITVKEGDVVKAAITRVGVIRNTEDGTQ